MKSPIQYLRHPRYLGLAMTVRCLRWLPDEPYLRLRYRFEMDEPLNLRDPRTLQEKLQWLKLHNRRPEMTAMVDKYAVKQFVADRIGAEHVIPTLGVWNSYDEIDFDSLPSRFILKTTHGGGGGGVAICRDKSAFNHAEARRRLMRSLRADIYSNLREWPYRDVPRRILAEQLLEMPDGAELNDYKIFCFNGEPRFLKVDFGRFIEHHANYYDLQWRLLPFGEEGLMPVPSHDVPRPVGLDRMLDLARRLAVGQPFLRVDLYNICGRIYFGELTFYPGSGTIHYSPREWDARLGDMLELPDINGG